MRLPADSTDQLLRQAWEELEKAPLTGKRSHQRTYRRLDLEKEAGIRLGCASPGSVWELLVQAGDSKETVLMDFPKWKGMEFEVLTLDVPKKGTRHIRFFVEKRENRDIFVTVCADLVRGLDGCLTDETRRNEIADFLVRWSRFFERHGQEGLSAERQRGLYGELWWLRRLIRAEVSLSSAVSSWKGCEFGYYDFEINGHAVEVKTTMTKEPRKVRVSNERQLDDRGLNSLHLLVLTLIEAAGGGETLPEMIQSLRNSFSGKSSQHVFEHSLREAGYLDVHAHFYGSSYSIIKEELFHVREGFPRIINIPQGLGDLQYSVVIAACEAFSCDITEYFHGIRG